MLQVVQDAARVAHARPGHDETGAGRVVQSHGFGGRLGGAHVRVFAERAAAAFQVQRLLVEQVRAAMAIGLSR